MKKITLRADHSNPMLQIPVSFFDTVLASAPAEYVKTELYLLRASLDDSLFLSLPEIAETLDLTLNTVQKALAYWQESGVLSYTLSDGEISEITLLPFDPAAKVSGEKKPAEQTNPASDFISTETIRLPEENDVNRMDFEALYHDEDFIRLSELSECYLRKPLTVPNREALAYCYLMLDKNADLTEYLLEYCIDRGRSSFPYFRSVAKSWNESKFRTIRDVKAHQESRNKNVYGIMKALGLQNREPVESELQTILSWTSEFELPLVLEACRRCMDKLHAPEFNYVSAILKSWKENGVSTEEDIKKLDEQHEKKPVRKETATARKNSFHNFPERDTDYDAIFSGDGE